jgi:hypothetical protein
MVRVSSAVLGTGVIAPEWYFGLMGSVIVECDERGRVSLARVASVRAERYVATARADGSIVLEPATVVPSAVLSRLVAAEARRQVRDATGVAPTTRTVDELLGEQRNKPSAAALGAAEEQIGNAKAAGRRTLADL